MVPASISSKPHVEPKAVIDRFLGDMKSAAKRTFPAWQDTLCSGIDDCAMSYDDKRAVLDVHPLDDYYFAGAVALEASKIRELFSEEQARELLSLIGEHVDAVADRKDRVVSDLVFNLIAKIDLTVTADSQKMPYDEVVSAILRHLGVDKIEATNTLCLMLCFGTLLGNRSRWVFPTGGIHSDRNTSSSLTVRSRVLMLERTPLCTRSIQMLPKRKCKRLYRANLRAELSLSNFDKRLQ